MRRKYRENKLDLQKIKLLEKLPYWEWNSDYVHISKSFNDVYDELEEWINTNDKLPSCSSKDELEIRLSRWCSQKRIKKEKGELSNDEINRLEKLNHWYWIKEDTFYS